MWAIKGRVKTDNKTVVCVCIFFWPGQWQGGKMEQMRPDTEQVVVAAGGAALQDRL